MATPRMNDPMPRRPEPAQLLTIDEVAEYLQIPVATLYQWRHKGMGPKALKLGRHLRYRPDEVEAWLEQQSDERPVTSPVTLRIGGRGGAAPALRRGDRQGTGCPG